MSAKNPPLRILVLSSRYPPDARGGLERLCASTVERLSDTHQVLVLTVGNGRHEASGAVNVWRGLPDTTTSAWHRRALCFADSSRAARVFRRALSTFSPDLIYIWGTDCIPHSTIAIALGSDVPVIFSAGDYLLFQLFLEYDVFMTRLLGRSVAGRLRHLNWPRAVISFWNRFDPQLRLAPLSNQPAGIAWASQFLQQSGTLSPYVRGVVEAVILPASSHVGGAVHASEPAFRSLHPGNGKSKELSLLFVGRVVPEKGVDVAIRATAELITRGRSKVHLTVVGPVMDDFETELRTLVDELGISSSVEFAGAQPSDRVHLQMMRADVALFPSTWGEPAGIVPLEAAAVGLPVVASRVGGAPEVLREEVEALYFARSDFVGCADQIERVVEDEDLRARLVTAASMRAAELSLEANLRETGAFLLSAYNELSKERGTPRNGLLV